jgi:hypothetical protein
VWQEIQEDLGKPLGTESNFQSELTKFLYIPALFLFRAPDLIGNDSAGATRLKVQEKATSLPPVIPGESFVPRIRYQNHQY